MHTYPTEEFSAAAAAALRVSSLVEGGDSKKGKVSTATLSPVVVSVLYTMFDTNGEKAHSQSRHGATVSSNFVLPPSR